MNECHLCPARFDHDDGLALHFNAHRGLTPSGLGASSATMTVRRQARRGAVEQLLEMIVKQKGTPMTGIVLDRNCPSCDWPEIVAEGEDLEHPQRLVCRKCDWTDKIKRQCFYILESQFHPEKGYMPSIVTEGEAGHSPLSGNGEFSEPYWWGRTLEAAEACCAEQNAKLGLTKEDVREIVESSVAAQIRDDTRTQGRTADLERKLGRG